MAVRAAGARGGVAGSALLGMFGFWGPLLAGGCAGGSAFSSGVGASPQVFAAAVVELTAMGALDARVLVGYDVVGACFVSRLPSPRPAADR